MRDVLERDRLVALESFEDLTIIWVVHLKKNVIIRPFRSQTLTCLYAPSQGLRLDTEVRQWIGWLLPSCGSDLSGRRIAYKGNVFATRINFCQCIAEPGGLRSTLVVIMNRQQRSTFMMILAILMYQVISRLDT